MNRLGHLGLSILLSAPIAYGMYYFGFELAAVCFMIVVATTCNLPDIDSILQRMTGKNGYPVIRSLVSIKHRGRLHTVYFGLLIGVVTGSLSFVVFQGSNAIGLAGFLGGLLGVIFHLFGDVVTPTGINFMPPVTENYSFDLFRFDNLIANIGFGLLGVMSVGTFIGLATQPSLIFIASTVLLYLVGIPIVILGALRVSVRYRSPNNPFRSPFTISFWLNLIKRIL